jgi:pre-60S factor REI1
MVDVAASTTSAPVGANGNPLFTCMACHIAFHTAEHQRQHYRTDWHRYNLKRKVAQLAPVTAEQFAEKLLAQRAQLEEERAQAAFSDECLLCGKKFSSENAYAQHLRSKKHKETELRVAQGKQAPAKFRKRHPGLARVSNVNGDDDTASASDVISMADTMETVEDDNASTSANAVIDKYGMVDETASPDQVMDAINERINSAPRLGEGDCLFCTHKADTLQANIEHMVKKHSFFIPDAEYLVDLPGLISYLADKISVANICLYCNGRGRGLRSMEAVRQHMIDKGHTKIAYETERDILEISDFYDFRPSYPDYQERAKKTDENGNIIETDDDEEGELIRYSNE